MSESNPTVVSNLERVARVAQSQQRKRQTIYHQLAADVGIAWVGGYPQNTGFVTTWRCQEGHECEAVYNSISRGTGCPRCQNWVNGAPMSTQQETIAKWVLGRVNHKLFGHRVDVTVKVNGARMERCRRRSIRTPINPARS